MDSPPKADETKNRSGSSGVHHSEFNPSKTDTTHLYQVWLHPNESGGEPRYAEKALGESAGPNHLTLLFYGTGRDGSTEIRQHAEISFGRLDAGQSIVVPAAESMPHAWIQVIEGDVIVLGESLTTGDGLAIEDAPGTFDISAGVDSQFLLFRLS